MVRGERELCRSPDGGCELRRALRQAARRRRGARRSHRHQRCIRAMAGGAAAAPRPTSSAAVELRARRCVEDWRRRRLRQRAPETRRPRLAPHPRPRLAALIIPIVRARRRGWCGLRNPRQLRSARLAAREVRAPVGRSTSAVDRPVGVGSRRVGVGRTERRHLVGGALAAAHLEIHGRYIGSGMHVPRPGALPTAAVCGWASGRTPHLDDAGGWCRCRCASPPRMHTGNAADLAAAADARRARAAWG